MKNTDWIRATYAATAASFIGMLVLLTHWPAVFLLLVSVLAIMGYIFLNGILKMVDEATAEPDSSELQNR